MSIKVLSIPAGHPYPCALQPVGGWEDITVLPDPVVNPDNPEQWWPHPAFTPEWWINSKKVDVVHVHFGFEHLTLQQTKQFTEVLDRNGIPLVLTLHDLDNPHLTDQSNYHEQLRILTRAATHVFTLSQQAAEVVYRRYGRVVEVTPHPAITKGQPHPTTNRAGVFLKSVRANVITDPGFYRDLGAEIYIHENGPSELTSMADHVHMPMDDQTLHSTIARHRVVVLPYKCGTHSGWLRMCRDLGVSVAVPDCGCYASQMPGDDGVATYRTGDGKDAARAVAMLESCYPARPHPVPDVSGQHRHVYLTVAGEL
ncbi:hypothetical protein CDES_06620 [Corynebacterium deserti GIMN1.010]|uniref:Glycosyltransferase subfamily 4-like N-terminal domain-containing protein n=1 Tax=Corynebacterium deserti GIMN1.010 TaxID=931089 RepID=A0A0M4CDS0_9CORY|nr:glycosyltransferase family 4 protein [Corynebacterium deserti]ALC05741.1 hypothetical protein CDES_06620 [Corynebacterium deserti GIMN1.010]